MIVLKRDRDEIRARLSKAFEIAGLTTVDGIGRELIDTNVETQEADYIDVYALENNTKVLTANDDFLDNYGVLFDEPRASESFAIMDDLQTVSLFLTDGSGGTKLGSSVTNTGEGLLVEKGTLLMDEDRNPIMRTLHTVELTDEIVYVKAVAIDSEALSIATGTLDTAQLDLRSDPSVDPNLLGEYFLAADNEKDILNNVQDADTETYRFVLQEKGASVNLSNERKINTVFDNLNVRNFVIKRINPASTSLVVYVETKNVETDNLVLAETQQQLRNIMPEGTDIRARPMVNSLVGVSLRITEAEGNEATVAREEFREAFVSTLNTQESGILLNFEELLSAVVEGVLSVQNAEYDYISINNRKLQEPVYRPRDIEKLFTYPTTVSFRV